MEMQTQTQVKISDNLTRLSNIVDQLEIHLLNPNDDGDRWVEILKRNPSIHQHVKWSALTGTNWMELLINRPELLRYRDGFTQ